MLFADYFKAMDKKGKARFAAEVGTSVAYLYQLAGGHKNFGTELAARVEEASRGAVTRLECLYPADYGTKQPA